jgi:hypothetical protein
MHQGVASMNKLILICLILVSGSIIYAQTPDWLWAKRAGGVSYDSAMDTAIDNNGNCFVTGSFEGIAYFGETSLTCSGVKDVFVAKLDANGNWLWATRAGGQGEDFGWNICTDSNVNCYVTGEFVNTATFGITTLTSLGAEDAFVAKLSANGSWLWAKKAGGTGADTGLGVASDSSGNCFLTGNFVGSGVFGETVLTSSGYGNIYVAKLDTNGNWLWAACSEGTEAEDGAAIATDNAGNCYVTGNFTGTTTIGATILASTGGMNDDDILVAKLDTNGNWLWANRAGGDDPDHGAGIIADSAGNIYISGIFYDYLADFGPFVFNGDGADCVFAAKLDTSGNWLWATRGGGNWPAYCYGTGISVDASGSSFVSGFFSGSVSLGSQALVSHGLEDSFAARLDGSGNWIWAVRTGETAYDEARGIATDTNGYSYLTGFFNSSAVFGTATLISSGLSDIFIARLSPGGTGIDDETVPATSALSQLYDAFPNPLHSGGTVQIKTAVAKGESGILSIYNLRGQSVASYNLSPGAHEISFDSAGLASGVYLYRLKTQSVNTAKKLVLLR